MSERIIQMNENYIFRVEGERRALKAAVATRPVSWTPLSGARGPTAEAARRSQPGRPDPRPRDGRGGPEAHRNVLFTFFQHRIWSLIRLSWEFVRQRIQLFYF